MHLPQSLVGSVGDGAPRNISFGGRGCWERVAGFTGACLRCEIVMVWGNLVSPWV